MGGWSPRPQVWCGSTLSERPLKGVVKDKCDLVPYSAYTIEQVAALFCFSSRGFRQVHLLSTGQLGLQLSLSREVGSLRVTLRRYLSDTNPLMIVCGGRGWGRGDSFAVRLLMMTWLAVNSFWDLGLFHFNSPQELT